MDRYNETYSSETYEFEVRDLESEKLGSENLGVPPSDYLRSEMTVPSRPRMGSKVNSDYAYQQTHKHTRTYNDNTWYVWSFVRDVRVYKRCVVYVCESELLVLFLMASIIGFFVVSSFIYKYI